MTGRRSHGRLSALNGVVHQGSGTLAGTIEALEMAIAMAGPATRVIPGHGLSVVG